MTYFVASHEKRNSTETEARENFVVVVRFQNSSNLLDCLLVLVERPNVMKRIRIGLTLV
jgi:hypothetical protein